MTRRLLDTTVAIALLRGDPTTLEKLSKLAIGDIALSALTLSELFAGGAAAQDLRAAEAVAALAEDVDVLPFDQAAAEAYGKMLRDIAPKRRRALDRMVAAQALSLGMTLVTAAPGEFADIAGLTLESWARP